ncbi:transcriptional regulator, IclR family [Melissococcus plutonius]|uniref:Transcriptional regulator, IclR family n=1 Tax=Melissococcus plutonius (strain ATCC 35311 / DSM 29964 / CIP 104052 / LMG 20360 / NCIMB 702443) TaxID=940190 RepID=F3YCA0_MELPT|nr:IclR family transcriptional regulator [Melissococcus plutonius]AIM25346.1 transcriptional regulator, IclR family [Melissococcus plutonius S1]KMT24059.1 transcriptional regulator, IclR family [Melissococcus plutonius]KMT24212.1 transcriptional regulator, IclR family [Melissococcus plutonius]KMT25557.1 transcriptional regulator, IclR family [Melissococcus plutonius]KMT28704.1 transcriptional regulator, IclR family [Melissococcus plutonius]
MSEKPYGTVLIKAAKILDFLVDHPNSSLYTIAQATTLTSPTTSKILDTLILIGYVKKSPAKKFSIGTRLIRYANQNLEQLDLLETTQPFLEKLQQEIDETIHLGILNTNEILYVNKLEPKNQTIRMSSKIGITRPLYNSAMGKAVLSNYTEEAINDYLAMTELIAYTENTITNPLKLKKELADIKKLQVAFDDEEVEKDIFCIGASIQNQDAILGAFSISIPKYRLSEETKQKIIQQMIITKEKIENAL